MSTIPAFEPKKEITAIVNEILPGAKIIKLKGFSIKNFSKNYNEAKTPAGGEWTYLESELEISKWLDSMGWIGAVIPENRIVADVDNSASGDLLKILLEREGIRFHCIKTPNGYQFIFKASEESTKSITQIAKFFTQIGVVIDTRTEGKGYIVFPTENTENRYILSQSEELDELPFFLRPIRTKKADYEFPIPVENGSRDDNLYRFAARLNAWGISKEEAERSLKLIYEYFVLDKTDFTEKQLMTKVRQGYKWEPERNFSFNAFSEDWQSALEYGVNKNGETYLLKNARNTELILNHVLGEIAFNEFTSECAVKEDLPWRSSEENSWQSYDYNQLEH
jgi:putative DNA primase/helicase